MYKITEEIQRLKSENPRFSKYQDEYLFSFVCYRYFYNEGDFGTADEKDIFVDGKNDGGIDLVTILESPTNDKNLVLMQSKMISVLENNQDIIDVLTKMIQTYENFKKSNTSSYNSRLRRILTGYLDELEEQTYNVELVVFIGTELGRRKSNINDEISLIDIFNNFQITLYDKIDIESQIEKVLSPRKLVQSAKIRYSKESGVLKYDNEKGILVNIWASSLKKIYEVYKNEGLFEQNFRYYFKQKTIDDEIKKSIREKKKAFWFLNNGIIIGAKSYRFDGYNIALEDFSIINGCQTTTLIGETDGITEDDDFLIHCKIIISGNEGSDIEIGEIAAASNSQKPIGVRDLKSNRPEQIRIKQELSSLNPPVYMEIKRGEDKKKTTFKYQNITNEYYAQMVASYVYQTPGTARSLKAKLFQDDSIYNKIFRNYHRPEFIYELILLANDYDIYKKEFETNDPVDEAIVTQGKFIHLAIIGFLQKYFMNKIDFSKMKKDSEEWSKQISENTANKIFSKDYDYDCTAEQKKTSLFQLISYELKNVYDIRYSKNEETSVANFFKRDKRYQEIILEHMKRRLIDTPTEREKLKGYMQIFSI